MKSQIGVKVLIQNSLGEYLFLKRSKLILSDPIPGWDIPGGRIEAGEELLEALSREVQEETGHELEGEPKLLAAQDIFVEKRDLHVVRLTYRVQEDVKRVVLSHEHTDFAWFLPKHLQDMTFEPYLDETIKKFIL